MNELYVETLNSAQGNSSVSVQTLVFLPVRETKYHDVKEHEILSPIISFLYQALYQNVLNMKKSCEHTPCLTKTSIFFPISKFSINSNKYDVWYFHYQGHIFFFQCHQIYPLSKDDTSWQEHMYITIAKLKNVIGSENFRRPDYIYIKPNYSLSLCVVSVRILNIQLSPLVFASLFLILHTWFPS